MTLENKLEVGFYCRSCSQYLTVALTPSVLRGDCSGCGKAFEIQPSSSLLAGGPVDCCPHCNNREFFMRKDFPQQLGCFIVLSTVGLSTIAYAIWGFLPALAVLVAASLADFLLHRRLGTVTVCYRCHCELRGLTTHENKPFDMHRAEEYENPPARRSAD